MARPVPDALVNVGADVRTISVYPIHHDKVIIADRQTVKLGSFNYSDAAARKNSENVLVNWGNPKLAEVSDPMRSHLHLGRAPLTHRNHLR
jgi:phosphatidylserine/phosphatidylglycerophosphate/cardiolipin synthase-like enzyme